MCVCVRACVCVCACVRACVCVCVCVLLSLGVRTAWGKALTRSPLIPLHTDDEEIYEDEECTVIKLQVGVTHTRVGACLRVGGVHR